MSVQRGKVTVTAWMDNKLVRVMSTGSAETQMSTVNRRQRNGQKFPISCPQSIDDQPQIHDGLGIQETACC